MSWKPVVVGVDASPQSARAAALGWQLARTAEVRCRLVHAWHEIAAEAGAGAMPPSFAAVRQSLIDDAKTAVETSLHGAVPDPVVAHLEVYPGRPATVLAEAAAEADVLVLGGRHHTTLGRWLVGSTAHQVTRAARVPVLIAGPSADVPRRIIAAVELSDTAEPTVETAIRYASLFNADLRVLHVVEPLETAYHHGRPEDDWLMTSTRTFEQAIWPRVHYRRAHPAVRRGPVASTIRAEVASWQADLLVVGSHGKRWMDRLLVGSTTQQLLDDLPASLLVVPVHTLATGTEPVAASAAASGGSP